MHSSLQQAYDAIDAATRGLTEEQMRRHPEGKWDIAAILEHLSLTYTSTSRVMSKCLVAGKPLATSASIRNRIARLLVVDLSYIPSGRKAPKQVVPTGIGGVEARDAIKTNLKTMDEDLAACEERFGAEVKVADHAILGPIPISEWRKFHLLHTLHHIKQVKLLVAAYAGDAPGSAVAAKI
jgi:hypothetical protein